MIRIGHPKPGADQGEVEYALTREQWQAAVGPRDLPT